MQLMFTKDYQIFFSQSLEFSIIIYFWWEDDCQIVTKRLSVQNLLSWKRAPRDLLFVGFGQSLGPLSPTLSGSLLFAPLSLSRRVPSLVCCEVIIIISADQSYSARVQGPRCRGWCAAGGAGRRRDDIAASSSTAIQSIPIQSTQQSYVLDWWHSLILWFPRIEKIRQGGIRISVDHFHFISSQLGKSSSRLVAVPHCHRGRVLTGLPQINLIFVVARELFTQW